MWNQRYSDEQYVYGTEPNDFLVAMSQQLSKGKALCIGEGEGRNAVWLAQRGFKVTAVDSSEIGLHKAEKLARSRGVKIETIHADLADFPIENQQWNTIISIFCHLPSKLREEVHKRCISGLHKQGTILLEAYTPLQLELNTGGPSKLDLMMDVNTLANDFKGLSFFHLQERLREVNEGQYHHGTGAVVQVLAAKS